MTTSGEHSPATGEIDEVAALAQALMDAARAGALDALTPVLDAGAPLDMRDADGNTMLMLAAYHGHADVVRELLSRGAQPDALNDRGQSPLAGAVFKGFDDVVATLAEAGADPDAGKPSARESAAFFGRAYTFN